MSSLIFSVKPEKLGGDEDVLLIIGNLIQNEIDQGKTYEDDYEKLYHLQCLHLETIVSKIKPATKLNGSYLNDLWILNDNCPEKDTDVRIAPLFLTPNEVKAHLTEYKKLIKAVKISENKEIVTKTALLADEIGSGNLIIEIGNPSDGCVFSKISQKEAKPIFVETVAAPLPEDVESSEGAILTLSKAISSTYAGKIEPVNLAIYSHIAIGKALRHFLYARKGEDPIKLSVGYPDGSQGRAFPFLTLPALSDRELKSLRELPLTPIGEITDRHPEMDILVNDYWFRNQVVSVSRPMAETDEIAYMYSKQRLADMKKEGSIRIAFYQVGFPPAAIGFYRALTEELIASRQGSPWIEVTPYYYNDNMTYEVGEPWA